MIKWYAPPGDSKIAGYALVIHGLNLKPEKMAAIINVLALANIKVLLLSLSGHGDNYIPVDGKNQSASRIDTLKQVSYEVWKNETLLAYQCVKAAAAPQQLPIYFVGYSLGGLLGCDLLVATANVRFDKMVLFAPAIKMRTFSFLRKLLSPVAGIIIPSATPQPYRSNEGTPIAGYLAMLQAAAHFRKFNNRRLNVPTLIFIDKQDELISYSDLKTDIVKMKLDRWHLCCIKKDAPEKRKFYHHLIIDAESIGINAWERLRNSLVEHLKTER